MKQRLTTALCAAIAAAVLAGAAHAGVEVALDTVRQPDSRPAESAQLWIDGDRIRLESTRPGEPSPAQAIIFDGGSEQLWQLDLAGQRYTRIDRKQLEALAAQISAARREAEARLAGLPPEQRAMVERMLGMNAADTASVNEEIHETNESEELDGRPCKRVELLRNGRVAGEACVASWKTIGISRLDFRVFKQLGEFQQTLRESVGALPVSNLVTSQPFSVFDELGGFPLRIRSIEKGAVSSETNFRRFEKVDVDASRFEVPAGFAEEVLPIPAAR